MMAGAVGTERRAHDRPSRLHAALERVAHDQEAWREVCDALADFLDAAGALLIPHDVEDRRISVPHSPSLDQVLERYVTEGWAKRDFRACGFAKAMRAGFVTDQDLITREEMRTHPFYAEFLAPAGLQWFVGTTVTVGGQIWGVSVQRSARQGPFLAPDIRKLLGVRDALGLAARRSAALGQARLATLQNCLQASGRATVALGGAGKVIWKNDRAAAILKDAGICSAGRLASREQALDQRLAAIVGSALGQFSSRPPASQGPVTLEGRSGSVYSLDVIPMPQDFAALLSGAAALATIHPVASGPAAELSLIADRFRLTRRESQLTGLLLDGVPLARAAAEMGITVMTARQYLKAVFSKTGTGRQAELIAFLAKFGSR